MYPITSSLTILPYTGKYNTLFPLPHYLFSSCSLSLTILSGSISLFWFFLFSDVLSTAYSCPFDTLSFLSGCSPQDIFSKRHICTNLTHKNPSKPQNTPFLHPFSSYFSQKGSFSLFRPKKTEKVFSNFEIWRFLRKSIWKTRKKHGISIKITPKKQVASGQKSKKSTRWPKLQASSIGPTLAPQFY